MASEALGFYRMRKPNERADLLVGSMFFAVTGGTVRSLLEAWSRLHPGARLAKTLVVDSTLMDRLVPPHPLWGEWLTGEVARRLRAHVHSADALQLVQEYAPALVAGINEPGPAARIREHEIEDRLGLRRGAIMRTIRRLTAFSALGACIKVDDRVTEILEKEFDREALDNDAFGRFRDTGVICLLDCERICKRAPQLLRRSEDRDSFGRRSIAISHLGWAVWSHEQSHATRPLLSTPEEELMAQAEAHRILGGWTLLEGTGSTPGAQEILRRLARRQPPAYRLVFQKRIVQGLSLQTGPC